MFKSKFSLLTRTFLGNIRKLQILTVSFFKRLEINYFDLEKPTFTYIIYEL